MLTTSAFWTGSMSVETVVHVHGLAHLLERGDAFLPGARDALAQHLPDIGGVLGVAGAALADRRERRVQRLGEQGLELAAAAVADTRRDRLRRLTPADGDQAQEVRDLGPALRVVGDVAIGVGLRALDRFRRLLGG